MQDSASTPEVNVVATCIGVNPFSIGGTVSELARMNDMVVELLTLAPSDWPRFGGARQLVRKHRIVRDWQVSKLQRREAEFLLEVQDPRLPRVHGFFEGIHEGEIRTATLREYVEGDTLADLVAKGGALGAPVVVDFAQQLLETLAMLHKRGFLHRDVKPSNLIRVRDDTTSRSGRLVLVDLDSLGRAQTTMGVGGSTIGVGTDGWHHPYQFVGLASAMTDLFGVGTTLFYLVTAERPRLEHTVAGLSLDSVQIDRMRSQFGATPRGQALAAFVERLLHPTDADPIDAGRALVLLAEAASVKAKRAGKRRVRPTPQPELAEPEAAPRERPPRLSPPSPYAASPPAHTYPALGASRTPWVSLAMLLSSVAMRGAAIYMSLTGELVASFPKALVGRIAWSLAVFLLPASVAGLSLPSPSLWAPCSDGTPARRSDLTFTTVVVALTGLAFLALNLAFPGDADGPILGVVLLAVALIELQSLISGTRGGKGGRPRMDGNSASALATAVCTMALTPLLIWNPTVRRAEWSGFISQVDGVAVTRKSTCSLTVTAARLTDGLRCGVTLSCGRTIAYESDGGYPESFGCQVRNNGGVLLVDDDEKTGPGAFRFASAEGSATVLARRGARKGQRVTMQLERVGR